MKSQLDKFYALIKDSKITMMTTRPRDGHLRSRAMAIQTFATGADLWFVTAEGTAKLDDIAADPHELYEPDWKTWFAEGLADRHIARRRRNARRR